jgi:hypothetical protein
MAYDASHTRRFADIATTQKAIFDKIDAEMAAAGHGPSKKWLPITDCTGPSVGGLVGVARSYGWKPEDE